MIPFAILDLPFCIIPIQFHSNESRAKNPNKFTNDIQLFRILTSLMRRDEQSNM